VRLGFLDELSEGSLELQLKPVEAFLKGENGPSGPLRLPSGTDTNVVQIALKCLRQDFPQSTNYTGQLPQRVSESSEGEAESLLRQLAGTSTQRYKLFGS
jgi:hypothetical protein